MYLLLCNSRRSSMRHRIRSLTFFATFIYFCAEKQRRLIFTIVEDILSLFATNVVCARRDPFRRSWMDLDHVRHNRVEQNVQIGYFHPKQISGDVSTMNTRLKTKQKRTCHGTRRKGSPKLRFRTHARFLRLVQDYTRKCLLLLR